MNKKLVIGISILFVILLLSVPILPTAQKTMVEDEIKDKVNTSIKELDIDKIRVLLDKIRDIKSNDECSCSKIYAIGNPPIIICSILWIFYFTLRSFCFLTLLLYEKFHIEIGNIIYHKIVLTINTIIAYLFDFECIDLTPNYYFID
jgi:hypothetical protein